MNRFAAAFFIAILAVPAFAYRLSTWIPTWDPAALESMQRNAGNLDEANPSWYSIAPDGGVAKNWNAEAPELRAAVTGTDLVPTIKNYINGKFDPEALSATLGSAEARERHAEAIAQLVVTQAFDGIDVDYEAMRAAEKENFSLFIELLATKLHARGKSLSVTVHAKTSDSATWNGPGAQDWRRIGAVADSVKIMAYDYHWSTSKPGAIAPLDWIASVAQYAVSTMPAGKVVIALPWYGYDWGSTGGKGVTWTEATQRAQSNGAQISRDENGEATFRYGSNVVYFQDRESYQRKIDHLIARFPGIGGFAHWRAGGEDPAIWDAIAQLRGTGGAPVAPKPGTFSISAPESMSLRAGEQASVPVSIVPIDGFDSSVIATVEMIDAFEGTAVLSTAIVRVGSSAQLTVAPSKNVAAGTYRLRLRFESAATRVEEVLSVQVQAASSFAIGAPESMAVHAGKQESVLVSIVPMNGFDSAVAASVEMIDRFDGTATLSAAVLHVGSSAQLTVAPSKNVAAGTYRLRLRFESAATTVEEVLSVQVQAASTFAISAPESMAVHAGKQESVPVSIVPMNGFDSAVAASVEMIDRFDGTATLSAAVLHVGSSAQLTVAPSKNVAAGTYRLRLRLVSPASTREQVISVEITSTGRGRAVGRR